VNSIFEVVAIFTEMLNVGKGVADQCLNANPRLIDAQNSLVDD
jgi:hypothetical protein